MFPICLYVKFIYKFNVAVPMYDLNDSIFYCCTILTHTEAVFTSGNSLYLSPSLSTYIDKEREGERGKIIESGKMIDRASRLAQRPIVSSVSRNVSRSKHESDGRTMQYRGIRVRFNIDIKYAQLCLD